MHAVPDSRTKLFVSLTPSQTDREREATVLSLVLSLSSLFAMRESAVNSGRRSLVTHVNQRWPSSYTVDTSAAALWWCMAADTDNLADRLATPVKRVLNFVLSLFPAQVESLNSRGRDRFASRIRVSSSFKTMSRRVASADAIKPNSGPASWQEQQQRRRRRRP